MERPSVCEICKARHHPRQAHRFETVRSAAVVTRNHEPVTKRNQCNRCNQWEEEATRLLTEVNRLQTELSTVRAMLPARPNGGKRDRAAYMREYRAKFGARKGS